MKSDMRILIVTRGLPFHNLGGMEAVAWDMARSFSDHAQVTVLTTSTSALPDTSTIDGVRVHCLPTPRGRYSHEWWQASKLFYLEKLLGQIDVVFSVSSAAFAIATIKAVDRPLFIAQAHGTSWGEFRSKLREMSILSWLKSVKNLIGMIKDVQYRKFDAIVGVGEAVSIDMRRFPSRWVIGDTPVQVIANGVPSSQFEFSQSERDEARVSFKIKHNDMVICSASRLHPQKGVAEGIEAFELLARDDPSLVYIILGDGPDRKRLERIVSEKGLNHRVHLIGRVERSELRRWLSAADIFLFPSKRIEGLALNVLEALACGLPVVASKGVLDARMPGISVNPESTIDIARGVEEALVNGVGNRSSKLHHAFTLEHAAARYIQLFQALKIKSREM